MSVSLAHRLQPVDRVSASPLQHPIGADGRHAKEGVIESPHLHETARQRHALPRAAALH